MLDNLAGFLELVAVAFAVYYTANKLAPLILPAGRVKTVALAFVGGWAASAFLSWGPNLGAVHPVSALVGAVLFVLAAGLFPFAKVLLGRG